MNCTSKSIVVATFRFSFPFFAVLANFRTSTDKVGRNERKQQNSNTELMRITIGVKFIVMSKNVGNPKGPSGIFLFSANRGRKTDPNDIELRYRNVNNGVQKRPISTSSPKALHITEAIVDTCSECSIRVHT